MLIALGLVVLGLASLIVAAALVSTPLAWAAFGISCFILAVWPSLRSWILRG